MLFQKISLYVPSTYDVGKPLPADKHERLVTDVAEWFSALFGGATATVTEGFYKAKSGEFIRERITIVTSYYDTDVTKEHVAIAYVTEIAQLIKSRYGQEAVTIETENGTETKHGIDFI